MHITTPFRNRYRVINRDRESWTYETIEEAVLAVKKATRHLFMLWGVLGDDFGDHVSHVSVGYIAEPTVQFIICTELGDVVSVETLKAVERNCRPTNKKSLCQNGLHRSGAWPGIHRRSWHRGSYYRLVQTKNERSWQSADVEDILDAGLYPNKVGRNRDLPTNWDEIPRGRGRSWKCNRATQWR